jgi:hypothetical protein
MEKHGAFLPHPKNIFEIFWEYLDLFCVHYKKNIFQVLSKASGIQIKTANKKFFKW